MIPVTKPFLPPLEEYYSLLENIWKRNWLTNNGPLVNELELKLKNYLRLDHLLFLGNGTIALQIAIKALDLSGEIITTPFSFVATTSSIVWEGCTPIFVDIDPETLNIDPAKIEQAITSRTSAILATHCFGNPCDIKAIDLIAKKHQLKVIYDAAHGFGTKVNNRSLFEVGDISTASFHATKVFHSIEGGAVITKNQSLLKKMAYLRNFGHDGPEKFNGIGINGKNSEFHAAMGLVNLKYADEAVARRKAQFEYYNNLLENLKVQRQKIASDVVYNYSYYPVIFESEEKALASMKALEINGISTRRYFYPSLSALDYTSGITPIADSIASRILCLPMYHDLTREEQGMVARILLRVQNN